MLDAKDPAIKLFGKTIPLPEIQDVSGDSPGTPASSYEDDVDDTIHQNHASSSTNSSLDSNTKRFREDREQEQEETEKDTLGEKPLEDRREDRASTQSSEEFSNPDAASRMSEDSVMTSIEKEATTLKISKTEEQNEACNSQGKTLKKPDKILPCPRCNSMETKFCYYNNYNVNQPRHFCKNCQRYWTAGGTMRNVPVGAGRRKNKNSASHLHQITVSEALQNAQTYLPNEVHHPSLKCNGPILTYGSDTPLIESTASVLNLADKTTLNCTRNGFHKPQELRIPFPYAGKEKGNDHSNNAFVTSTKLMEDAKVNRSQEQAMLTCQSYPPQVPSFPGAPWPFPWNPLPWTSAVPPPAFCPPGYTMPFYPAAAYWGCTVSGAWNIPWLVQPSSPKSVAPNSGPNSPNLGKHSREGNMLKSNDTRGEYDHSKENNKEKCLWVPKTLRIDDPAEAAKSSIWTTLGIKNDEVHKGGLFKAFPSKYDEKIHSMQTSPVLQANPAALSRSLDFHETS